MIFAAIIQPKRHETDNTKWNRYARAGCRLFNGITHNTAQWPKVALNRDLPCRDQVIEASPWYFVQLSAASAVAGRWGILSQQLDDGCHGDRSFVIVSIYIANYRHIFCSVAEPSDVRLYRCQSTTGHPGLIMIIVLALSDKLLNDGICCHVLWCVMLCSAGLCLSLVSLFGNSSICFTVVYVNHLIRAKLLRH